MTNKLKKNILSIAALSLVLGAFNLTAPRIANASCYYGPGSGDYSSTYYSDGSVSLSVTNENGQSATTTTPSQGRLNISGSMTSYIGTYTNCTDGMAYDPSTGQYHTGIYEESDQTSTMSGTLYVDGVASGLALTVTQTGSNFSQSGDYTSGSIRRWAYSFSTSVSGLSAGSHTITVVGTYAAAYSDAHTQNYGMTNPSSVSASASGYVQSASTCSISVSRSVNGGAAFTSSGYNYLIYGPSSVTTTAGDNTYSNLVVGNYTISPAANSSSVPVTYQSKTFTADAGSNSVTCTANTTAPLPLPYITQPDLDLQ